jgi:hypothetical protein
MNALRDDIQRQQQKVDTLNHSIQTKQQECNEAIEGFESNYQRQINEL